MMNRFGDIDSSFKKLKPVYGFLNAELVTIERALQPIESQIANLPYFVKIAKKHCHYPSEHGLTHDESASIYIYTMEWGEQSLYCVLNQTLRNENRHLLKVWFPYMKLFDTALNKLPTIKGVVWRGVAADIGKNFHENDKITWWSINSCSSKLNVIKGFLENQKNSTMFLIEAVNGKKLSGYTELESEDEIILKMGTEFHVKCDAMEHPKGSYHVHLIEIDEKALPVPDVPDTPMFKKNKIFIHGLPSSMPEQLLFNILYNEFSTVSRIKIDEEKKIPLIYLYKSKMNEAQLSGYAEITFENEEAVAEAIKKYNRMPVPALNNDPIFVKQSEMKSIALPQSVPNPVPFVPKSASSPPNPVPFVPKSASFSPNSVPFVPKSASSPPNPVPFTPKSASSSPNPVPFVPKSASSSPNPVPFVPKPVPSPPNLVSFVPKSASFSPNSVPFLPKSASSPPNSVPCVPKDQEPEQEESDSTHDTDSIASDLNDVPIFKKNAIFIRGLPSTMTQQLLFNTLDKEFSTVGRIKIDERTQKSSIYFFKSEWNNAELSGCAEITFEKQEAVIEAIKKYDQMPVPALNNARIGVKRSEKKSPAFPKPPFSPPKPKWGKWKQNAITVAGGSGYGQKLNHLNSPFGIFIDKKKNIFIADWWNHRIVEWKYNAKEGQIIAGGNGYGDLMNQLNGPTNMIVDQQNHSIIIADRGNRRVIRWLNQNHQILIQNTDCYGLTMDKNGFLYVSDYAKNEVRRWKMGEYNNEGIVVAGGNGKGNKLNQLNSPGFIFVDGDQSVYVSDRDNHRVMKWRRGAKEGTIVAGGHGYGRNLNQLSKPEGVIVDDLGQIYVADYENHLVMRWCERDEEGEIVVGGNGQGYQSHQLNCPTGLSFDDEGNLYVVDWKNHRIEKFEIVL
ncbi:unnamed protein product [Adineta steineri]|uniref:RRM domain-containing protein n=1 Tax=Adineta steineri TaxID=433720 RepID=A0A814YV86_9BILA|nr:unnamed protein product [Adineta steineri]CAF3830142.1 unnamed protein product [Adineta steineri]